jgi:hypothetical protein
MKLFCPISLFKKLLPEKRRENSNRWNVWYPKVEQSEKA